MQVVSFGRLGVLGRNGWFCREADVERWNAVAGWRGLKDPAVRLYFNETFLAFEKDWGDEERRMSNAGLVYHVSYLGVVAADEIQARLVARLPTFFYLWSPHPFNARYSLNRIQLPAYTPALFKQGLADFPTDVLEKVASKQLAALMPMVAELYSLFEIDNFAQESMLAAIDVNGLSAMQAACDWMRKDENIGVWQAWLPTEKHSCDAGYYALDEMSCALCPAGSGSIGGTDTACVQCSPGKTSLPAA